MITHRSEWSRAVGGGGNTSVLAETYSAKLGPSGEAAMNISIQMCQLLALCLAMTAVEGMRVRVRGRRPRPFIRHGRPRRPVPVFLAVPGGQAVPVFPLGGQPQVQPTEAAVAVTEPQSPAPLSLSPAHPQPPQPSPSEAASTAPTEPALPRPAAPSAFDNFDEDFFDESGPFGGSLPPFPDISAIFSDVATGRSDPTPSTSAEGRGAPLTQENALRRLDSDWQGAEDDSSWPVPKSQDYADLYFRASSPKF